MSTFRTAAQRRAEAEAKAAAELEQRRAAAEAAGEEFAEPDPNEGRLPWPTEEGPFFFQEPSPAQLGLLGSRLRDGTTGVYTAFERLARNLLRPAEFAEFMAWIERGDIDFRDLMVGDEQDEVEGGLLGYLSEATGRPTQPSSDSSPAPKTAGTRSTGRARSQVSTPST